MDLSKGSASTEANVIGKRSSYFARILFAGVALGCTMWPEGAVAQYPNRLIKLIVPYVAGGPSDMVARTIADKLSISLKQALVIENRPGAGGNIGTDVVSPRRRPTVIRWGSWSTRR